MKRPSLNSCDDRSTWFTAQGCASLTATCTVPRSQLLRAIDCDAFDEKARQIPTPAQLELFMTYAPLLGYLPHFNYRLQSIVMKARRADATAATTGAER
jgi:hypothetical protein